MKLLEIKQNVKRAWAEGWTIDKVTPELDALFALAERSSALEGVREAALEFEQAVALNMVAGGKVAPMEQAIRLMDDVRVKHRKLRDALNVTHMRDKT